MFATHMQYGNKAFYRVSMGKVRVWFSYETPIALDCPEGLYVTSTKYSRTTARHARLVDFSHFSRTVFVDEAELLKLIEQALTIQALSKVEERLKCQKHTITSLALEPV